METSIVKDEFLRVCRFRAATVAAIAVDLDLNSSVSLIQHGYTLARSDLACER